MNVLIVTPYYYPALYYGGPVRVVYECTRRLVKLGHDVTVYTTDVLDSNTRHDKEMDVVEGVRVRYFRNISNNLACRSHAFLPIGFYSALRNGCSEFDVIHIHEYYTFLTVSAARFARKHNVPFLLSAHGSLPVIEERGRQGRKIVFNWLFSNMILRNISGAIALNEEEKKNYKHLGVPDEKIDIIPNGIDTEEFCCLPEPSEFRNRYNVKRDEKIILFVGRIHEIKGLDILINAFNGILQSIRGIKLVLAGPDDGYMQTLKGMALGNDIFSDVIFTGLLSGKEKLAAYSAADIFVLPSRSEGFPVTVLEACASGLPVILTDRCNFPEIKTYGAGLEVPCMESPLYEALISILGNDEQRKEMGNNGKSMVLSKYNWDSIVKRLEEVYRNVVSKA